MLIRAVYDGAGWVNHPEAKRFQPCPHFLPFRHELIRLEMIERWGVRHRLPDHKTPVVLDDAVKRLLVQYFQLSLHAPVPALDSVTQFEWVMNEIGFPSPAFRHDAPWDRDKMTRQAYIELGDAWNLTEHKHGGKHDSSAELARG